MIKYEHHSDVEKAMMRSGRGAHFLFSEEIKRQSGPFHAEMRGKGFLFQEHKRTKKHCFSDEGKEAKRPFSGNDSLGRVFYF